jgi:UDP-N-acetylmuramyl pentapeptide phosphotransferase/UDP-N-acetylglucosamine-1-phosphate transferase
MNYTLTILLFIVSVVLCAFMMRFNISATPTQRCSHDAPTPTAGGLVFFLIFFGNLAFMYLLDDRLARMIPPQHGLICHYFIAVSILIIVGLHDDCSPLSYRRRLIAQFVCAFLIVLGDGVIESPVIETHSTSVLFFQKILTLFTFLCLINAANFIDGLNGLLSLCVMITLAFAPIWVNFCPPLVTMHSVLIAAILGFFVFNFPKGRLFMGDTGSTFLGFTLGFLALFAQPHYPRIFAPETAIFNKGFVFTLLPMAFLWFDVAFTLCRRAVRGCRLTEAHRDHMIHILYDKGYGHIFVTLLYATCTCIMGCLTYMCHKEWLSFIGLLAIYAILQGMMIVFVFNVPHRHQWARPEKTSI